MLRRVLLSLFIMGFCFLFPGKTLASGEFQTSFDSTYTLQLDGKVSVYHKISITNNLANIYLTKYTISLGSENISDLRVLSEGKKVPATLQNSGAASTLEITIPKPVIGKDQVLSLEVNYQTPNIAKKSGNVWELNIPRVARANEYTHYVRQVAYPTSLGPPTVAIPRPSSQSQESGQTILSFVGFPGDSISLLFGSHLDYKLNLRYYITNTTSSKADTEIALPPDTEYQQVLLDSIDPQPKNIRLDDDGNWLATYTLKPGENQEINAVEYVSVYPQPHFALGIGNAENLVSKQKYWDKDAANIVNLASQLKSPEFIYDYLLENFVYDFKKVGLGSERLGGSKALNNPNQAVCTEFTDTFISLARALNIPAREINGFTFVSDSPLSAPSEEDFLHAWPEYFDSATNTWVQIDPTLGNTTGGLDYFSKLDYSHIAFVIHGEESDYPYPAGAYKADPNEKSITVELADSIPASKNDLSVTEAGKFFQITNHGNSAAREQNLTLPSGHNYTVEYLPPLATLEIPVSESANPNIFLKIISFFKHLFNR